MFKKLGKIKYRIKKNKVYIKLDQIKFGVNYIDDFIIYQNKKMITIYDRICDHNGGKLISKNNKTFCPMHNWEFQPENGSYTNGLKKKSKKFKIVNDIINISQEDFEPIIYDTNKVINFQIKYINHACIIVKSKKFKFATDPWTLGPAFNTGWWLKHKSTKNWKEELNSCDFIYISHNHPDHCHELTLSNLNKDIPIIVPKFNSDSTGILIEDLGFKKIYRMDFENQYQFNNSDLVFTLLKSGDLREDSGMYFSIGKFKSLLTVDSNNINFLRLPKIDLLASSFAGGAHGYPLNCENYSLKDRIKMTLTEKNFAKKTKIKYLRQIKPKYFMPYAGFFTEKLKRDKIYIKYNLKNKTDDFYDICNKLSIKILDPEQNDIFKFKGKKLIEQSKNKEDKFLDLNEKLYLKYYKLRYDKIDLSYIKEYFLNSNFHDNSNLFISVTDENFVYSYLDFKITFLKKIKFRILKKNLDKELKESNNYLYLKIRKESFLNTIYNKKSWEDISIGFQNKQYRKPNTYNNKFWFHFSNNYVAKKHVKSLTDCSSCVSLKEDIQNLLYNN